MKTLIIINPKAGKRIFLKIYLPLVLHYLESKHIEYSVLFTQYSSHATDMVKEKKDKVDIIIVFGGDGTIREVVEGMVNDPIPIGIIPFGTVNVLAIELGIPFHPVLAIKSIVEGRKKAIDIGYANGKSFILMMSTGIDALAVHFVNLNTKKIIGPFAYIFSAIRSLFLYKPREVTIYIKDKNIVDSGFLTIILNSKFYGGRFMIDKDAAIDDGEFTILVFKRGSIIDTFRLFMGVLMNNHDKMQDISLYKGKEIIITSKKKILTQMDGEKGPLLPLHITILKQKQEIIIPDNTKKNTVIDLVASFIQSFIRG